MVTEARPKLEKAVNETKKKASICPLRSVGVSKKAGDHVCLVPRYQKDSGCLKSPISCAKIAVSCLSLGP